MRLEKHKDQLIRAGYWGMVVLATYLVARYLLPALAPVLWGFAIAWMLRPVVRFICRHSGMGRRGAAIVSATVLAIILMLLMWLVGSLIAAWAEDFIARLPDLYRQRIAPVLVEINDRSSIFVRRFSKSQDAATTGKLFATIEEWGSNAVSTASVWSMELAGAILKGLPKLLLNILFALLSTAMICADYDAVCGFVTRQIPQNRRGLVFEVRDFLAKTALRVLKTYLIIMGITFVLLAAGLGFLRIENFIGIAALIAVLDLLPIVGSGLVLVPWGIYQLLGQETFTGMGLLLLWVAISVVREVLEPKILGDQIGLHPVAALISMFVGLSIGGIGGLFAAPILCLLVQFLQKKGVVHLFR